MILSIILSVLIPLLFLYIIGSLEIYAVAQRRLIIVALGSGALAFGLAFLFQTELLRAGLMSYEQITGSVAPIVEEVLKAGLIIALSARMRLRDAVDGTIYGFAIGTSFAIGENILYIIQTPDGTFGVIFARLLSTSLMHTFTTAVVGTMAGSGVYLARPARINRIGFALITVIFIHALFNRIASTQEMLIVFILGMAIALGGTGLIITLVNHYLKTERRSIEGELSNELSSGEVAAALNPDKLADILSQHRSEIDGDQAHIIRNYIMLQGQRALLKKGLDLSRRPKFAKSLELQIQGIEQRLAALRSEMGLYTWIWLRTVLPSEESAVWESLADELGSGQPLIGLIQELSKRHGDVSAEEIAIRKMLLKDARIFHRLESDDLDDLALLLRKETFIISEEVITKGAIDENLYIVASGNLVVSVVSPGENEIIINTYDRGSCFGELTLLDQQPYPVSVTCLTDVTAYTLPRASFLTLLYAKPQVGLEMMRFLVDHIRQEIALLVWIQQNNPEPAPV
jgi:CRP-like cAMP-binding protein/RsiW-degrading membrane proteinase PrsW (M82 family)